jgi:carotenoid cleavage dioxygenase-like enzyme
MDNDSLFHIGFDRNQVPQEEISLQASQAIPPWLSGSFIRNGPGLFYIGKQRLNHWFDGLAMLHKFDFYKGNVKYKSRFLDCRASQEALSKDQLTYSEFATDPCWNLFGRVKSMFKYGPTDSAKVNVAKVGDQYFALGETTMQIAFDIDSLDTIGQYNYNQPKFGTSTTAHPHIEKDNTFNLITKYGPINYYQVRKMDAQAHKVASVQTFTPSYMHSFGMSESYYVIAESPYAVQSLNLIAKNKPFIENFHWDKKRGTRIWVVDRSSNKVIYKTTVEPFFFFHFINTFDTSEGVAFDIVTYPDAKIIEAYYLDQIASGKQPLPGGKLKRISLNFNAHQEDNIEQLSNVGMELPHMDSERYQMRPDYRYVYSPALQSDESKFYDQLVKVDIQDRKEIFWKEPGCYPGEPIFVPNPKSAAEDDGILISLVLDADKNQSFLLLLRAADLTEISRVWAPEPILVGFHGNFFKHTMV